jgi:hypothetical protein
MSGTNYLLSLFNNNQSSDYANKTFLNQKPGPFIKYGKDRLSVKYIEKAMLYTDITVYHIQILASIILLECLIQQTR